MADTSARLLRGRRALYFERLGHLPRSANDFAAFSAYLPAVYLHSDLGQFGFRPRSACSMSPAVNQRHHLTLPAVRVPKCARRSRGSLLHCAISVAFDRRRHGIQHVLITEGLGRKSTAPAFIARTVIGISPVTRHKMIGM